MGRPCDTCWEEETRVHVMAGESKRMNILERSRCSRENNINKLGNVRIT
jgi:hypothetical protein